MFDNFREDIEAFRLRDPAATSNFSIWLNSPGMRAIWAYRRQHWWWEHGHPLLARWLSTRSRRKFGVEIHPGATIGRRFIIDHGMGIVVGETTIIGDDCMIYQGVTLGGTGKQHGKRHPTLGDGWSWAWARASWATSIWATAPRSGRVPSWSTTSRPTARSWGSRDT